MTVVWRRRLVGRRGRRQRRSLIEGRVRLLMLSAVHRRLHVTGPTCNRDHCKSVIQSHMHTQSFNVNVFVFQTSESPALFLSMFVHHPVSLVSTEPTNV